MPVCHFYTRVISPEERKSHSLPNELFFTPKFVLHSFINNIISKHASDHESNFSEIAFS